MLNDNSLAVYALTVIFNHELCLSVAEVLMHLTYL